MDARVRDKIGLELIQINVESSVESQARGNGRHDLSDESIEMGIVGSRNVEIAAADIVNGVIVDEEGTVRILDRAVSRQDGIVGLNYGSGDARSWIDSEFELRFLAIVGRESLQEERSKT